MNTKRPNHSDVIYLVCSTIFFTCISISIFCLRNFWMGLSLPAQLAVFAFTVVALLIAGISLALTVYTAYYVKRFGELSEENLRLRLKIAMYTPQTTPA